MLLVAGVFGLFGNEIDAAPDSVLRAEPRLAWVVNNAYRWKKASKWLQPHK